MARHHMTANGPIPFTAEEEAARDAEEKEWAAKAPERELEIIYSKRKSEYPKISELTVALYDTDDKAAIEKRRADVKAKYPKPE